MKKIRKYKSGIQVAECVKLWEKFEDDRTFSRSFYRQFIVKKMKSGEQYIKIYPQGTAFLPKRTGFNIYFEFNDQDDTITVRLKPHFFFLFYKIIYYFFLMLLAAAAVAFMFTRPLQFEYFIIFTVLVIIVVPIHFFVKNTYKSSYLAIDLIMRRLFGSKEIKEDS